MCRLFLALVDGKHVFFFFFFNFGLNVLFSGATKADLDAEDTPTIDIDIGASKEGSRTGM